MLSTVLYARGTPHLWDTGSSAEQRKRDPSPSSPASHSRQSAFTGPTSMHSTVRLERGRLSAQSGGTPPLPYSACLQCLPPCLCGDSLWCLCGHSVLWCCGGPSWRPASCPSLSLERYLEHIRYVHVAYGRKRSSLYTVCPGPRPPSYRPILPAYLC